MTKEKTILTHDFCIIGPGGLSFAAGAIKVLVSPKGYVLGATILGVHAGELIYPWVMAIQNKLKLTAITSSIAPYPTLSDISKRIAGSFYTEKVFSPSMKTVVRFIMRCFR